MKGDQAKFLKNQIFLGKTNSDQSQKSKFRVMHNKLRDTLYKNATI